MIKEFKNGNISIKFDTDTIEDYKNDSLFIISEMLWTIDTYIIGDPFCMGNDCLGLYAYNVRLDKIYTITSYDDQILREGKAVRLYASDPDTDEKKIIDEFFAD